MLIKFTALQAYPVYISAPHVISVGPLIIRKAAPLGTRIYMQSSETIDVCETLDEVATKINESLTEAKPMV